MALLWLAVAIVAIAVEVAAPKFVFLFAALAAFLAAALAVLGVPRTLQIVSFLIAALLLPFLLRGPLVARVMGRGVPSRTDSLIGEAAEVTETIDSVLGIGRVVANGQDWAARSSEVVPVGTKVKVLRADGIVLIVGQLPPDAPPS